MKKLIMNHLIIPKFVLERKEMNKLRGGTSGSGGSARCCDCSCVSTTNSGCISGSGTDLGKKAAT